MLALDYAGIMLIAYRNLVPVFHTPEAANEFQVSLGLSDSVKIMSDPAMVAFYPRRGSGLR